MAEITGLVRVRRFDTVCNPLTTTLFKLVDIECWIARSIAMSEQTLKISAQVEVEVAVESVALDS